ncbi:hypothetical protein [Oharaeibacter diazotrophicus]|uniref:YXWGXW repeat-containing protein n=1 Tax=Oharaeibacter diazotrophicus TaxID=1920512 RepID=A0A4V3CVC5_9HYPH|nr:hypothetical protein [Oharaeibacter diazotrophicus]TDP81968.1 hypothetical protein EDD54_4229 [Oharaeibacter diazotrophicus]BBE73600.1 hypothetical protein OHA_1_03214 [Pleomorphomonas sp. SM30]GLS75390.1 hypothetical protein GCM10007904_07250 [Oharaeibacter diazotrophicus]
MIDVRSLRTGVIAVAALAATVLPAAADGFSFGFRFGDPEPRWGWRAPPPPPPVYYRGGWRNDPPPMVRVCRPGWVTRKFRDDWGRVYKVVRVREQQCRWVPR